MINLIAGMGYTYISELLTKKGVWQQGGLLIHKIFKKRKSHDNT